MYKSVVYSSVHFTSHFIQGSRKTQPYLTGHPVPEEGEEILLEIDGVDGILPPVLILVLVLEVHQLGPSVQQRGQVHRPTVPGPARIQTFTRKN